MFDLLVLGGGPGGYLAAERAAAGGLNVALFEQRNLGGVCLNEGCIPTKTLLNAAKYYDHASHGQTFGVSVSGVGFDHEKVIARKNAVVGTLVAGVTAKLRKNNITVINSLGVVRDKTPGGITVCANGESYTGKNLIIATGSKPAIPPITGAREGLESGYVLTSREILELLEPPEHLVIIGGGVIGLEIACYFQTVGSNVTVIEAASKIGGSTDDEIAAILQRELEKKGIDFRLKALVHRIESESVHYEQGGKVQKIRAQKVLLCTGRTPNTDDAELYRAGIFTENGAVVTDEHLRTNIPGIYAVGDVNGRYMLAHTAYREAEVAVNHILGKRDYMRYSAIPSVIYTFPEAAGVGHTEQTAEMAGIEVDIARVPGLYSGRFAAETGGEEGLCKLVVERQSRRILGVHLISPYAGEIIYGAALMVEMQLRVEEARELVFPHPAVSELIREGLFMI